jgi:hypothetical protein
MEFCKLFFSFIKRNTYSSYLYLDFISTKTPSAQDDTTQGEKNIYTQIVIEARCCLLERVDAQCSECGYYGLQDELCHL